MALAYAEQEGLRVLGAIRQSKTAKTKDAKSGELMVKGVSLEEQKSKITKWTAAYGHQVVKLTEDPSTSGKTSPFRRKGIGPYLSDPALIESWDLLVATKLDRIARSAEEFLGLMRWAKEHNKVIKVLNLPDLDDSDPSGKLVLTILAAVAEMERGMASERRTDTLAELEAQGRWAGGPVPYGWRAVQHEGKPGWYLEPDEGTAPVLRQMAAMSREGKSNGQVARWLNEAGHLNAVGKPWSVERVRLVLHAKATADLLDLDAAGASAELAAALKARSETGTKNRGERVGGSLLLRVAYCRNDGRPLYYQRKKKTAKHPRDYYRCLQCHQNVNADWLEATVEKVLLGNAGGWKLTERRLVRGDGSQAAINELRGQIRVLETVPGTETLVKAKRAEIATLEAAKYTPDKWETVETGQTLAEHWATLDHEGRGSLLRKLRITVKAGKSAIEMSQGGGPWEGEGWLPVLGLLPPKGSLTGKSGRAAWKIAA